MTMSLHCAVDRGFPVRGGFTRRALQARTQGCVVSLKPGSFRVVALKKNRYKINANPIITCTCHSHLHLHVEYTGKLRCCGVAVAEAKLRRSRDGGLDTAVAEAELLRNVDGAPTNQLITAVAEELGA